MAAPSRVFRCLSLLQRSCAVWSSRSTNVIENNAATLSGASCRFYRGSNRDTRRRERNERARQRKREGIKPKVFDKREFININYDKELFAFKSRLSLQSIDDNTLRVALTHESYQHEDPQLADQENSKLSILGYNLTTHHITEFLCFKYPSMNAEGIRCLLDFLTSRETIVQIAQLTALPELIRTEFDLDTLHQEKHLNYTKEDIISDAFYALIGAIYSDKGSHEANKFIQDFIIAHLQGEELINLLKFKDPENLLKDIVLAEGKQKPEARVIRESGKRTHLPVFVVGIFSGDTMLGEGDYITGLHGQHQLYHFTWETCYLNPMSIYLHQESIQVFYCIPEGTRFQYSKKKKTFFEHLKQLNRPLYLGFNVFPFLITCHSLGLYFFVSQKHLRRYFNMDEPPTKNVISKTCGLK